MASSTSPYLIPTQTNVTFQSIVTVGEDMPNWPAEPGDEDGAFVGIPDGIGAYDNGDGTITVLVNHELPNNVGVTRDHGFIGAFVDRLVIDKETLTITASDDLINQAFQWNVATHQYEALGGPLNRFCSGDLAEPTAYFNASSGLGTTQHVYLAGEETAGGRLFASIVETGESFELARLGNMAYENAIANPYAQDKTLVFMTDDTSPLGQTYLYVGTKTDEGSVLDQAGLTNGSLYGIKVEGLVDNNETTAQSADGLRFSLQEMGVNGDVSAMDGAALQTESEAEGVTEWLRPEDGAWDPDHPNVLYFVVTGNPSTSTPTRLYQLTFDDITHPELGGSVEMLVEGLGGDGQPKMMDNLTVDNGKIVIQEDPGNDPRAAKVWQYDIASGQLTELAHFNPDQFVSGGSSYIGTQDEESSGVLDVTDLLGDASHQAYLLDAQVHMASGDPATVEKGQLNVMYVANEVQAGTNADDSLEGNGSHETINGLNGNDSITAWGGNDLVNGGNGNDTVHAGTGVDAANGGNGDDWLDGGFGNDTLNGDKGSDHLIGGGDLDTLTGGQGGDFFIFDNNQETGDDLITDFSKGDLLLVTHQLDSTGGIVDVSGGLHLYGTSDVEFGNGVAALQEQGTIVGPDGVTYYAYSVAHDHLI